MIKDLINFKSVAVIGAAREEEKVGHVIFKNLLENKNLQVFPVNPHADEILGVKCFSKVTKIKEKIDCAIVVVKSNRVIHVMKQVAKKKIGAVIIISAGFSEAGNYKLEEKIKKIAEKNNISLLGPNVLGILNMQNEINASFFRGMPGKGEIAFLSQSGAIGTAILDESISGGINFSYFISLGNSAVLDFSDFIEYFSKDEETKVIAVYMESLKEGRGRRFIEVCRKCKKPIVILKSGKTQAGERAAQSHTSALASEKGIYEGIFKQAGLIETSSIKELFSVSKLIAQINHSGNRACVITNAGGLGVLCADSLSENGIELPELNNQIKKELGKILPEAWSNNNPIDILGDALAERYEKTIQILENENFFDFFIFLLTPQHMTQPLETANVILNSKKPSIACFIGGNSVEEAMKILGQQISVFSDVKEMGDALGKVVGKK